VDHQGEDLVAEVIVDAEGAFEEALWTSKQEDNMVLIKTPVRDAITARL
jgi:hypothetical protein